MSDPFEGMKVVYVQNNYDEHKGSHEELLKKHMLVAMIYLAPKDMQVWGDDWNDAPAWCNSGTPYLKTGMKVVEVRLGMPLKVTEVTKDE